MTLPRVNMDLLRAAGFAIETAAGGKVGRPPTPAPFAAPPVRRPPPLFIVAPTPNKGNPALRKHERAQPECRDQNICIYCRTEPAKYFGPGIGYAAGCPRCTVINAAINARRKAARPPQP